MAGADEALRRPQGRHLSSFLAQFRRTFRPQRRRLRRTASRHPSEPSAHGGIDRANEARRGQNHHRVAILRSHNAQLHRARDWRARGACWSGSGVTFLGAAFFASARSRRGHIPQEAFIGIAYAVASAMAILLMSKATGETEHLKDMLVGNILAVSRPEVIKTALLYSGIGLFHFIFRKKFLLISMNPNKAEQLGFSVRFWDFLFYPSFGFVVTSSVAIAAVLLVFFYLIVPNVAAML